MNFETVNDFNIKLHESMTDDELLMLFASSKEFKNFLIYTEEEKELKMLGEKFGLINKNLVWDKTMEIKQKVIILLYTYLNGNYEFRESSLYMDHAYIIDNAARIFRCILEICIHKHLIRTTFLCLNYISFISI